MPEEKEENIVFPQKCNLAIDQLIEKYGLSKAEEENIAKLFSPSIPYEEWKKLWDESPKAIISSLVRKVALKQMRLEDLPFELQERLNLPLEKATTLAEELYRLVIVFAREAPTEKEEAEVTKIKPAPKEFIEKALSQNTKGAVKKKTKKQDIYREPIE